MGIDLDVVVRDRLLLRSVPGAVDYLAEELRRLTPAPVIRRRRRDGLLVEYAAPLRALTTIRYFSSCAVVLSADPVQSLADSLGAGVLAALRTGDTVHFRVGELGSRRWPLRDAVVAGLGWINSPAAWDVNLEDTDDGIAAEVGALHLTQRFGALGRAPASTTPVIAAVLVRLAKIEPGHAVLDPFCGAATELTIAGETTDARLVGLDADPRTLRLAAANLADRGVAATLAVADATELPIARADRVIANLPFGKRVGSHRGNVELYPAALREIARVLPHRGRAVLLTEDKRLFKESVQRTRGLRIVKEIVFDHGGARPSAYALLKRG